jgi:Ulp1 family protease
LVQEVVSEGVKRQMSVYFVSKVLSPSRRNYKEMQKILYAVLTASRKFRHYFQSQNIIVPSSQPLKDIIRNIEALGLSENLSVSFRVRGAWQTVGNLS